MCCLGCESVREAADYVSEERGGSAASDACVSVPVERERMTVYDEAADGWKLVPGKYVMRMGDRRRICRWSRR